MRRLLLACGSVALLLVVAVQPLRAEPEKKTGTAKPAVIPVFRLGGLSESPGDEDFSFSGPASVSLKDVVARMKKAADDPAVKAVVVFPTGGVGHAQIEELRQVMAQIRAAGKEIYAHCDSMAMGQFVLASGASRLSVVPTGDLWITGLNGESPYLRKLLDMLDVKPDFLTCGAYKSAAETFMRSGPSPEAEKMQNWLLDSLYETDVKLIAKGRNVDADRVKAWIDAGPYSAEGAKKAGMIDAVEHRQDFEATLRQKFGKTAVFDRKFGKKMQPKLDLSSPFAIFKLMGDAMGEGKRKSTKDAVAIVYVDGAISLGSSGGGSLFDSAGGAMSTDIRKALDEAARDDSIKAVVLRVDSPGGSAVASEIILDATKRVKAKKPFVVSMGDVAGSGGYYVACASDVIFADENTITGSIGVVSGKFATNGLWNKAGITFKSYSRGANAGILGSDSIFTEAERTKMQGHMDEIYGVFKGHVTASRGSRLAKPIDELAGGRVFTGKQALELGLVDKIGTMQDAVNFIAGKAKLSDYEVRVVPETKPFFEKILEEISGTKEDPKDLSLEGRLPRAASQASLLDLAMPYLKSLDPERVKLIKTALFRMEMMQREGVILMMPEMRFGQ